MEARLARSSRSDDGSSVGILLVLTIFAGGLRLASPLVPHPTNRLAAERQAHRNERIGRPTSLRPDYGIAGTPTLYVPVSELVPKRTVPRRSGGAADAEKRSKATVSRNKAAVSLAFALF